MVFVFQRTLFREIFFLLDGNSPFLSQIAVAYSADENYNPAGNPQTREILRLDRLVMDQQGLLVTK